MDVYYYSSDGAIADIVNAHSDISPSCYLYEKTIKKEAVKEKVLIECKKYVEDICRNDGKAINIRKRRNIILTANNMAAAYSGASCAGALRLLRASTEMVAVLLYKPPMIPDTRIPDSWKTYRLSK